MHMNRISTLLLIFISSTSIYAQTQTAQPLANTSAITPWISNTTSDKITIENGTGANLSIMITVNKNIPNETVGINVDNCGKTKHINAGSSAICVTSDFNNPVTFNSDQDKPVSGTYQITKELPR